MSSSLPPLPVPLLSAPFPSEARFQLSQAVKEGRNTLGDGERITGKWNKDDKVLIS